MLASASPRRAELLRAAGFDFETLVLDVDESVRAGEHPRDYVRRLASEKAERAMARLDGDGVVIGADTAVVVDGDLLGKPTDEEDAARMLRRLSGRSHEVMTGVCLRRCDVELVRVETTRVEFAPLTEEEIAWYARSGEGQDKAGAYAIQGLASRFILSLTGSYSNVVGLPVACVYELLTEISEKG